MTITIGDITFDRVRYDAGADVLYLHVGDPSAAVTFDESPEGHHLRYDAREKLIGMTIVNPKRLLEQEGKIALTIPQHVEVGPDAVGPALVEA